MQGQLYREHSGLVMPTYHLLFLCRHTDDVPAVLHGYLCLHMIIGDADPMNGEAP